MVAVGGCGAIGGSFYLSYVSSLLCSQKDYAHYLMTIGLQRIARQSFDVVAKNFAALLPFLLIPLALCVVFNAVMFGVVQMFGKDERGLLYTVLVTFWVLSFLPQLYILFFSGVAQVKLISAILLENEWTYKECINTGYEKVIKFAIVKLSMLVIVVVGFILFIVPGIFAFIVFITSPIAVVLENDLTAFGSLKRSFVSLPASTF